MESKNKKKKIYTQKMLHSMAKNHRVFWFKNLRKASRKNRALLCIDARSYQRKIKLNNFQDIFGWAKVLQK